MVLGAAIAVFSNNLKYILACSSLSQIGFILVGTAALSLLGQHNALAAHGTVLYMMNHSLVKLTLFLLAGVVYCNTHALDLNQIRGYRPGKAPAARPVPVRCLFSGRYSGLSGLYQQNPGS